MHVEQAVGLVGLVLRVMGTALIVVGVIFVAWGVAGYVRDRLRGLRRRY